MTQRPSVRAAPEARLKRTRQRRWLDVVGRDPVQLERIGKRLGLPLRLVPLTLAEHLYPTVLHLPPAWFLATHFTTPSRRHVFTRDPLYIWLAEFAVVTISPWTRHVSGFVANAERAAMREGFLHRLAEAAVNSHEEVGRRLHEAFVPDERQRRPYAWHYKERRVAHFARLLDQQLHVLRAVGIGSEKMRQLDTQLAGLAQIAHHVDRKLRQAGACPLCRRNQVRTRRRGR